MLWRIFFWLYISSYSVVRLILIRWCSCVFSQASLYFWRFQKMFVHSRRVLNERTLFWRVVHICDASKMTLNYSRIFARRVENVQDASPKYATIFQCYFGRVMEIFDASKWHLWPLRQNNWKSFKFYNILDAPSQLRDASKMQLWPQWLTIFGSVYNLIKTCFTTISCFRLKTPYAASQHIHCMAVRATERVWSRSPYRWFYA